MPNTFWREISVRHASLPGGFSEMSDVMSLQGKVVYTRRFRNLIGNGSHYICHYTRQQRHYNRGLSSPPFNPTRPSGLPAAIASITHCQHTTRQQNRSRSLRTEPSSLYTFLRSLAMPGLSHIHTYLPHLLAPTHPYLPFGLIDLFGAARLSLIIDWIASGVFDPPAPEHEVRSKTKKKKIATKTRSRATLLQELFGLMVVLFGGETFLCAFTGIRHL
jgi:hypothetical protein